MAIGNSDSAELTTKLCAGTMGHVLDKVGDVGGVERRHIWSSDTSSGVPSRAWGTVSS